MQRIIRFKQLKDRVPYSRMHIYRLEKAGCFPRRVSLGPNSVGWLESEVDEWIASRTTARNSSNQGLDPELAAMLS